MNQKAHFCRPCRASVTRQAGFLHVNVYRSIQQTKIVAKVWISKSLVYHCYDDWLCKWFEPRRHIISVNCDCPGECSPEKDCLRWHWLTFRQPERKSSSQSIDSDDDFRSGCRNVSQCHLKQSFWGLHSPGRPQFTELWLTLLENSWKVSKSKKKTVNVPRRTSLKFFVQRFVWIKNGSCVSLKLKVV